MIDSLLVRRYLASTVAVALGVALLQLLLVIGLAVVYRDSAARRVATVGLLDEALVVEEAVASGRPWSESERRLRERFDSLSGEDEMAVYDASGKLLARSTGRTAEIPPDLAAATRRKLDSGVQFLDQSRLLLLAVGVARDIGGRRYYLVRVDNVWGAALPEVVPLALVALLLPMTLLGLSGAFLILRMTSRQLSKVDRVLRLMSSGDLSARLSLPVDPDTAGVVLSFNRMAEKVSTTIEKLRRSDESRRQLLADVTHELNTPLTSVLGYLETLTMVDLPLPEARRLELTRIAFEEAVNLRALIEDLTTLSRLDAEGLTIERARVPLAQIVQRVLRRLSQMAEKRGVPLRAEILDDVEVKGDPQRLDQVVRNLVENALRHTSAPGDVRVVVRQADGWGVIEVIDRGTGMPPEAVARIGQRFLRLDRSRARDTGGRGLGLAIAVGLIEMHGGEVEFQSEVGSGTRVQVRLPLLDPAERELTAKIDDGDGDGDSDEESAAAVAAGGATAGEVAAGEETTATPAGGTAATTTAAPAAADGPATPHRSPPRR